ncbi:MAG TPA: ergothioneine biosynthesis protein EgtB [Kofleriaceae bacterium]|nr:ergothioneine biosynthesis protein EgtB [Kofleriaceae bacterium]
MSDASVLERYRRVRERSPSVCAPLSSEDAQIQSMPDASPAKWHLAHTTWFFETFVLREHSDWAYLFNSYYEAVGARVERARRGLMTRPSLADVLAYRARIDDRMHRALSEDACDAAIVELGLHHEQQHQELLLTDIKHAFGTQPMLPAYREDLVHAPAATVAPASWLDFTGGTIEVGARAGFAFDCERPRHRVLVPPFRLATRPVCNAEVLAFIADGGYREPRLWLSDGFATVQREGWTAPLYWHARDGAWLHYTLGGVREIDPAETACHLSYFEADAIARWAGARLPTEFEWEHAATSRPVAGNFADDDRLHPTAATGDGLRQLYGDVWEWTQSAFAPYPGFRPADGALGEYNGKFMCGQLVLRGGSCFTPRDHIRASYRNFFAPAARWQMTGVRLCSDGEPS